MPHQFELPVNCWMWQYEVIIVMQNLLTWTVEGDQSYIAWDPLVYVINKLLNEIMCHTM